MCASRFVRRSYDADANPLSNAPTQGRQVAEGVTPIVAATITQADPNTKFIVPLIPLEQMLPQGVSIVGASMSDFGTSAGAYLTVYYDAGTSAVQTPVSVRQGTAQKRVDAQAARIVMEQLKLGTHPLCKTPLKMTGFDEAEVWKTKERYDLMVLGISKKDAIQ